MFQHLASDCRTLSVFRVHPLVAALTGRCWLSRLIAGQTRSTGRVDHGSSERGRQIPGGSCSQPHNT
ncbi:MAG: hypothetical protein J07HX64_01503 [halophilic archaeon J07HX64]|nr:MAG: hypothetical protein J07HX64_01503 [halophilic archaeon J07HX64]